MVGRTTRCFLPIADELQIAPLGCGSRTNVSERVRIVSLGGGFRAVYTAMHLERLQRRDSRVEIAVVNRENCFVLQPMLAEVVSGNMGLLGTVSPINWLIPRCRLYVREVESVDLAACTVTLAPGFVLSLWFCLTIILCWLAKRYGEGFSRHDWTAAACDGL